MNPPIVLIVDDHEDSRLILRSALRKKGYLCLEAGDGAEGVRMALEHRPDLVIMDVVMPELDGYEALRRIRMDHGTKQIPVMVVTALNSMEEKISALEAGADGFLTKPFDRHMLLEQTGALIRLSRSAARKGVNVYGSDDGEIDRILHRRSEELIHYYYTDALTGLPNRSQLLKDIRNAEAPGLLLLDINGFKDIVYFYGHEMGDGVLKALVERLFGILDAGCYLHYRISGDIFAVLIPECQGIEELASVMEMLNKQLNEPSYLKCLGHEIPARMTIGGSVFQPDLLASSEKALKTAKATGQSCLLFDESKEEFRSYEQNIFWTNKISEAIAADRIVPYFQPIVCNISGAVEKYECLVRLIDGDGTVHTPYQFLEISKKSRYYAAITKSVIDKALCYFEKRSCIVTINLSARDMIDPGITNCIYERLEEFDACERVVFELLESEGVQNYDAVCAFIERVKGYGCQIAIDDFGSGYSNFIHLVRLNVDIIKIDGSLIRDLDRDENAKMVVETIVDFAEKMGVKTVAEFVHSEAIHRIVTELGVDYSQGFYLGKPKEMF